VHVQLRVPKIIVQDKAAPYHLAGDGINTPLTVLETPRNFWIFLSYYDISMENGPFIDGLPIKKGGFFHGYVK
jgi:hypothetical protein